MNERDSSAEQCFLIGPWRVDVQLNTLSNSESEIVLEPKVMSLLAYLCRHPGQTVSKDEILENVWGGPHFADSVVARAISILRKSLDDQVDHPRYIKTIPKRGYRFIAAVDVVSLNIGKDGEEDSPAIENSRYSSKKLLFTTALLLSVVLISAWLMLQYFAEQPVEADAQLANDDVLLKSINSIAVLPFEQVSQNHEYAYLANSLHDAVAMQMARYQEPRVFLLPSAEVLPGEGLMAGRRVEADAVLAGMIDTEGETLTVTLRLQDPNTAELLWSADYQNEISATQTIRKQIVRSLVAMTRSGLEQVKQSNLEPPDVDPRAYQAYLQGISHWRQRSPKSIRAGHELFQRAIDLDNDFAAAYASLALSTLTQLNYLMIDSEQGYAQAAEAADRALALDPFNAKALTAKAQIQLQRDWNLAGAIDDLQRAIESSPGIIDARQYLAEIYSISGQHEQAMQMIDDALSRQPYSLLLLGVKGMIDYAAGHYQGAIDSFQELERYDVLFLWHLRYWSYAHYRMNNPIEAAKTRAYMAYEEDKLSEQAYQDLLSQIEQSDGQAFWEWHLAYQERDDILPQSGLTAFLYAEALAAMGQDNEAMIWIEQAVNYRTEAFLNLRVSPMIDHLRQREDYRQLLSNHSIPIYRPLQ